MGADPRHPFVQLAMDAIETYVKKWKAMRPPVDLPDEFRVRRGAFVSIKKFGNLRGCIGTIRPTRPNLAEEIISNAISAAVRDPRFDPIAGEELAALEVSVDVLTEPEPVKDLSELDPKRYGVIVSKGYLQGVLLPDIGVETVEEQIDICRRKAGIMSHEEVEIQKFQVVRYR